MLRKGFGVSIGNFNFPNQLLTESTITYGVALSVKQHLALKNSRKAPISVYYFNFRGRFSQSYAYTYTSADFGVCHSDELLYLFRNSAMVGDYQNGTPELIMAKGLVDYFVKLAHDG